MRIGELGRNAVVVVQVVGRHLVDDPVVFALQVSRRLPDPISRWVAQLLIRLPGAGFRALGYQMRGRRELYAPAQELLRRPGRGIQRRIAAEVAIGYGLVDWRNGSLPAITRARAAWDSGAVSAAVELAEMAGARAYARRLRGEINILDDSYKVLLPEVGKPSSPPRQTAASADTAQLRVLHLLTNSLPDTQSGYTLRSHRLLCALGERGVKAQAATRIGYPVTIGRLTAANTVEVDGISYRRALPLAPASTHPQRLTQWAHILLAEAAHHPPQLIHTTTNYPNALVAEAVAKKLGVPWIYEARGIMEETWVSSKKTAAAAAEAESSQRFRLIRQRETGMMMRADHVITLSETMKNIFVSRGVPSQKITVIPNAVDSGLLQENLTPVQARQRLGLDTGGFWVGSVSSLVDYEGFDTLLLAVAQLRQAGHDVRVLLAGDGAARPGLQGLAAELAAESTGGDFTVFLGKIPRHQAALAHQALNLFVVPRRNDRVCRSVTPLKPIEAMALGRATVMSDIPPLSELVNNSVSAPTGKLCTAQSPQSCAAAILDVMGEAKSAAYAAAGRQFARTRTWTGNAARLEDLYHRVVKEGRGG